MERALGWPRDTFTRAYEANRSAANFSAIEASPVASAVQAFVAEERVFEGTATELLNKLSLYAGEQAQKHRAWPDSGWKLSAALRRLAPSLRASGVEVTLGERRPDHKRSSDHKNCHTCVLCVRRVRHRRNPTSLRTHSDASTSLSDGASQPCQRSNVPKACIVDALDAADAPLETSMVRGEI